MTITGSPRDTDLFQGLDVTFACNIELSSAVDSPIMLQSSWQRNETILESSSDDHITVTNTTAVMSPTVYQTTVRFNPLNLDDADTYTCAVTITPQNETFIAGISEFTTRSITGISSKIYDSVVIILWSCCCFCCRFPIPECDNY